MTNQEIQFACGHSVSHEEDCPRCEIERLRKALNVDQEFHNIDDVVEIRRLRAALERYGRHAHPNCHDLTLKEDGSHGPRNGCLCGLDAVLSGEPHFADEPTARRSGELLPCENCGHGIVAHVQNGGNCPTPPLKSTAQQGPCARCGTTTGEHPQWCRAYQ